VLLAAAVAFAVLVGVAGATERLLDDQASDEWPAQIVPLVEFVERERGLSFEHPVTVDFMSESDFEEQVTRQRSDLTDSDREDIENTAGLLRAIGLIAGDVDLFDSANALAGAGVLGYYDDEDKAIRLRGGTLSPTVKVTLVHELTHALQDQHFDIGGRMRGFQRRDSSEAASAFRALVEGDANRVEAAYRADLDGLELEALTEQERAQGDEYTAGTDDVPAILQTMMVSPYVLGDGLLELADAVEGPGVIDEMFQDPPSTDEHLMDPWTFLADDDRAAEVDAPSLPPGVEEVDSGAFGAIMWYLMLAEQLPLVQALDAADGWAGDAHIAYERDGITCMRARYQAETDRDRQQMHDALRRWSQRLPESTASVSRDGAGLLFESCDPGIDSGGEHSEAPMEALQLALARTYLAIGLLEAADAEVARCAANRLVHEFSMDEIVGGGDGADDLRDRVLQLVQRCN
jgi:hypothetical protein